MIKVKEARTQLEGFSYWGQVTDEGGPQNLTGRTLTLDLFEGDGTLAIQLSSATLTGSRIHVIPATGEFYVLIEALTLHAGKTITGQLYVDWVLFGSPDREAVFELELTVREVPDA